MRGILGLLLIAGGSVLIYGLFTGKIAFSANPEATDIGNTAINSLSPAGEQKTPAPVARKGNAR